MPQLSQKEYMLLQDQAAHEQVCIESYQKAAQKAADPELQQLFQTYAQQEQQHLNTINSILNGQTPNTNQNQQQGQQQQKQQPAAAQPQQVTTNNNNPTDALLCKELLMAEKYVSGAYDTTIFEMADKSIRQALNHIQKEEQEHGEGLFNYMNSHGMYPVGNSN